MARVVFFSFDYDDVWRVNQVRNSGAFIGEQRSGFRDKVEYEQVKRTGDTEIKNWIRKQMLGCSVTCVLIGADTHRSKWVNFEIEQSIANGMGLLGVYIHLLKDQSGSIADHLPQPNNPLGRLNRGGWQAINNPGYLSQQDNPLGRLNRGSWQAVNIADRMVPPSPPPNPLDNHVIRPESLSQRLFPDKASARFKTYTWQPPDSRVGGENDLGAWVEKAARRVGR